MQGYICNNGITARNFKSVNSFVVSLKNNVKSFKQERLFDAAIVISCMSIGSGNYNLQLGECL